MHSKPQISGAVKSAASLLIIDDNPGSLELLSSALAQPGLEIFTASNPEEGMDLFCNRRPQIVLTDLVMPDVSGIEVLERIMEIDPATDVILITAHGSSESAVDAIRKGASDYLNKPVSIGALRERVGKVVEKARKWQRALQCTDVQQQIDGGTQLKMANQALQQSNADLEQFAYAASHDLQEPLRMISIYSQLLKEEYGNALDGHALSYIDFVVNGARRMSNLLTALLTYSRVANAAPQISPKTDALSAVNAALLNLSTVIDDTRASIEVGTLPTVQVPEIHLLELFQNLIGNGLKYRKEEYPDGERPIIRIDAKPDAGGTWLFSVSDNGIGIEPEYLTEIFGIFKRLHGSAFEGTGIGLALCQKIVERAGGHIWAESEPGKGSIFFFRLQGVETCDHELAVELRRGVSKLPPSIRSPDSPAPPKTA